MDAPLVSVQKPTKSKSKKDKEKSTASSTSSSSTERLKVIVRRLPPNLPEDVFWGTVADWVTEDTIIWKLFYPGKLRKKMNKENIPSRAYIAFKEDEQLATFSREYDGHVFRDKAGNESQAIVEFAPYQKLPTEKKKVDARNATIEKDDDYISFMASLEAAANAEQPTLEALLAANQPAPRPTTTPLLEALKAAQSARMDKEAILRAHMHYKDPNQRYKDGAKPPAAAAAATTQAQKGGKKGGPPANPKAGGQKQQQPAAGPSKPAGGVKEPTTPKKTKGKNGPGGGTTPKASQQQPKAGPSTVGEPGAGAAKRAARAAQGKPAKAIQQQAPPHPGPPPGSGSGTPASEATPAPAPPPAPQRRTRPVIGIASRQFQDALSGAGVRNAKKDAAGGPSILQRGGDGAPVILQREPQQPKPAAGPGGGGGKKSKGPGGNGKGPAAGTT